MSQVLEHETPVEVNAALVKKEEGTKSFASFLQMLEDGLFHSELSDALKELNAELNNRAMAYGKKAKASMKININFCLDGGIFEIDADYDVKLPKLKRDKSVAWSTPGNNFSPHNPKQLNMFEEKANYKNAY
jgi:hypothetical protein